MSKEELKYCTNSIHLITYVPENVITDVIETHSAFVDWGCWILHNNDECEPHFHVWLKLKRSRVVGEVCSWFKYGDINTRAEKNMYKNSAVIDYALHRNSKSIDDGKFLYDKEALRFWNTSYPVMVQDLDKAYLALEDMLEGVSLRDLARTYGKDFIYHFKAYQELRRAIEVEEAPVRSAFEDEDIHLVTDLPFDVSVKVSN